MVRCLWKSVIVNNKSRMLSDADYFRVIKPAFEPCMKRCDGENVMCDNFTKDKDYEARKAADKPAMDLLVPVG